MGDGRIGESDRKVKQLFFCIQSSQLFTNRQKFIKIDKKKNPADTRKIL